MEAEPSLDGGLWMTMSYHLGVTYDYLECHMQLTQTLLNNR